MLLLPARPETTCSACLCPPQGVAEFPALLKSCSFAEWTVALWNLGGKCAVPRSQISPQTILLPTCFYIMGPLVLSTMNPSNFFHVGCVSWAFSDYIIAFVAVPKPDLDSYVFLRVKERQENILVEPETDEQRWVMRVTLTVRNISSDRWPAELYTFFFLFFLFQGLCDWLGGRLAALDPL